MLRVVVEPGLACSLAEKFVGFGIGMPCGAVRLGWRAKEILLIHDAGSLVHARLCFAFLWLFLFDNCEGGEFEVSISFPRQTGKWSYDSVVASV